MIIAISWKNIWRNKTRSLVVITAVTLGTIAGVFVAGLMNGWVSQRIDASIYTEMGHLKIQNPDYLVNEETRHSISNIDEVKSYLENSPEVKAYTTRSKVMAMASTARGSSGLMLKGINVEKDTTVSDVYTKLIPGSGTFFGSKSRWPQVFISNKTAEDLRIKMYMIKDETIDSLRSLELPEALITSLEPIVNKRFITKKKLENSLEELWSASDMATHGPALIKTAAYFQQRAKINFSFTRPDGDIGYQTFQVCGVFKTSNTLFDQMSAFVKNEDLYPAVGIGENEFHELSIILNDDDFEYISAFRTKAKNDLGNLSVLTWKELAPDAGMMADIMQVYYYIIMGIIFFALAFGIINTMLMAILERVKELGMLMAIGMKKLQVFTMIMLETIFLTLTGSIVGMLLGALIINITGNTGINFSSVEEGFEAVGWAAIVYPTIEVSFFFGVTVMVIIVAILSSIIPARKALKFKPIEALRTE
jgi:ABC-type lipoprotein release transport system permease subunit